MKKLMGLTIAIALLFIVSAAQAEDAGEAKWYDMENCAMCKNITAETGLMENMTWEQHKISNGVLSVATVAPEFMEAYTRASDNMDAMGKKLMSGEKVEMCGSCNALGSLFPQGLQREKVNTANGCIAIYTSDKPEIITELHAWTDKNAEEMKKMMAAHAGHEHN